jgi:hypothetical protein
LVPYLDPYRHSADLPCLSVWLEGSLTFSLDAELPAGPKPPGYNILVGASGS